MSIYRTEVSFPLFPGGPSSSQASRRGSQSSQPPKKKRGKTAVGEVKYKPFTSLSDFTARAGTKLKHLVRLLSYLLADDEALPVTQFDRSSSEMIYPALPIRDTAPPRTRKIIVSIAFTMMVKAFLSVSNVALTILSPSLTSSPRPLRYIIYPQSLSLVKPLHTKESEF